MGMPPFEMATGSTRWKIPLFFCLAIGFLAGTSATQAAELAGVVWNGDRFTVTSEGVTFGGILLKPEGKGPFPGLLISHGRGGSAEQMGRVKGGEFVRRGYVCIAPDYTHAETQGDRRDFGASEENIRRAGKCLDILLAQPEVDPKRVYAYGHSMGAFLTIALAAREPERLAAVAITAGGITPEAGYPSPPKATAEKITLPFLILHGSADTTVPPERSRLLQEVLEKKGTVCERQVFDGVGHSLPTQRSGEVGDLIDRWFRKYPRR